MIFKAAWCYQSSHLRVWYWLMPKIFLFSLMLCSTEERWVCIQAIHFSVYCTKLALVKENFISNPFFIYTLRITSNRFSKLPRTLFSTQTWWKWYHSFSFSFAVFLTFSFFSVDLLQLIAVLVNPYSRFIWSGNRGGLSPGDGLFHRLPPLPGNWPFFPCSRNIANQPLHSCLPSLKPRLIDDQSP